MSSRVRSPLVKLEGKSTWIFSVWGFVPEGLSLRLTLRHHAPASSLHRHRYGKQKRTKLRATVHKLGRVEYLHHQRKAFLNGHVWHFLITVITQQNSVSSNINFLNDKLQTQINFASSHLTQSEHAENTITWSIHLKHKVKSAFIFLYHLPAAQKSSTPKTHQRKIQANWLHYSFTSIR